MPHRKIHESTVADAAVSPDGTRLVSGSWDGTVSIWDIKSGDVVLTYPAHKNGVHHVRFDTNSSSIITSGHDGTVRRWSAADREQ